MLIIGMSLLGNFFAVAELPDSDTKVYLTSRFILWDKYEKMIDDRFDIHIHYYNDSDNYTFYYEIIVDNNIKSGYSSYYKSMNINVNDSDYINNLEVKINNETVFSGYDIVVITDIKQDQIERVDDSWLISLNPMEWRNKEWKIFFAVICSGIVSMVISFTTVKAYRKFKGVKKIE
jgi:hypothetical protein